MRWNNHPRWLLAIEVLSLGIWLTMAGSFFWSQSQDSDLLPLEAAALQATQGNERWNGIFLQDQHVGFSVNRSSMLDNGGMLLEQRSLFKMVTFGKLQTILTAGAALIDDNGHVQRFDFFMNSELSKLSIRGEVKARQIIMEIDQGNGEIQKLDFPIEQAPQVSLSMEMQIRQREMAVGAVFTVPYFDPLSMSNGEMTVRVVDSEVLDNGEEAWWLVSSFNGFETRALVTSNGDILRQESAMGTMVRMTAEAAQQLDLEEPIDMIGMSAVPLKGKIKNSRELRDLRVGVEGVDIQKIAPSLPIQSIEGNNIIIHIPEMTEFKNSNIVNQDAQWSKYLESTLELPAENPQIRAKVQELLLGIEDRVSAVQKINQFVFDYMEKTPVIGVPNGLNALKEARGDCNEHTALFASLARAGGIPTRVAAGIVFSDRVGPLGQFYYHAWPEVLLETQDGELVWLPVDPTFGEVPANATHIKLVEGGLDRQVEILGFLGQLKLSREE